MDPRPIGGGSDRLTVRIGERSNDVLIPGALWRQCCNDAGAGRCRPTADRGDQFGNLTGGRIPCCAVKVLGIGSETVDLGDAIGHRGRIGYQLDRSGDGTLSARSVGRLARLEKAHETGPNARADWTNSAMVTSSTTTIARMATREAWR